MELETPSSGFIESVKESIEEEISKGNNSTEKGHRFLKWVVPRLFDVSPEELDGQITDGPNDMGIDAWSKIEGSDKNGIIQLFQIKYGDSYDIEKEILKFKQDVSDFLKKKPSEIVRDDLRELHNIIHKEELETELYFITNQKIEYNKKGNVVIFGFNQIVNTLWDEIIGLPKGKIENLQLETSMEYGKNAIIGVLSLKELTRFVEKTKSWIFESNIRKYLKRTKINEKLIETLKNDAENVFYYNNGISIVVKDFTLDKESNKLELKEPQIVNGAQTSSIIAEKLGYGTNSKGSIQVTIIKETNKTTREEITRFRNSQNAVKGKDLISLQHFHTKIGASLANIGYFYETQAGSWLNKTKAEKTHYKGNDIYNNYFPKPVKFLITAKDAIQAMVSGIFQNPTKPYSSISSYMPYRTEYANIFNDKLKEDYRLLLYPYLIRCYSENLGYHDKNPDPPAKKYARLLFVATYFKILMNEILKMDNQEIIKEPKVLEPIFKNIEVNKQLLDYVNNALDHYFIRADEYMREKNITWHNFFAKYAWEKPMQNVIQSYVNTHQENLKKIKQNFKL